MVAARAEVGWLREAPEPISIVSFGSARAIAAAYNREPELFRKKLACLYLSAGGSSPPYPGYMEWNVQLDPHSLVCLLRSGLPIALFPDAANNDKGAPQFPRWAPALSYDSHNTYYNLPSRRFISQMDPPLRRYLEYALGRSSRSDFLRATEVDGPPLDEKILAARHHIWETAIWIGVSGRRLVKRADGSYRIVLAKDVAPTDRVLPNELRPCTLKVHDNGIYEFQETTGKSNVSIYFRGDPRENETALREALPALYLSFKAPHARAEKPAAGTP